MDILELYTYFKRCRGVTTDSRAPKRDSLFIALKGERFDGNDFALDALAKGCAYAVVDRAELAQKEARCLYVEDSFVALTELARTHRRRLGLPIIGITGTNGKTTTKELISAVLRSSYTIGATVGNLNNQIGVPLTLLSFTPEMQYGVVEMGASHIGDIAELTAIAEPDFGLITNIGRAHLEGFGSFEGVTKAKCELYDWLGQHQGEAWVNADDPLLMQHSAPLVRTTYGTSREAFFRASLLDHPLGYFLAFAFYWQGETYRVHTQLVGKYNLPNALAAVAVGLRLGVMPPDIVMALEHYTPSNSRSQYIADTPHHNNLVVDAYNANPSSMHTAIENFLSTSGAQAKYLILGDMFELGSASREEHLALVQRLARETTGITCYLVGKEFAALESEAKAPHLHYFPSTEILAEQLRLAPIEHAFILVKASRGMHFESLVELC